MEPTIVSYGSGSQMYAQNSHSRVWAEEVLRTDVEMLNADRHSTSYADRTLECRTAFVMGHRGGGIYWLPGSP